MQALSDLVKEKREDLGVQQVIAKPMTPNEASWLRAKNYLDSLTGNYLQLFTEAINSNPLLVSRRQYGRFSNISLTKNFEDHEVRLEVIEDENKLVKRVTYFVTKFNLPPTTYHRNIIGNFFKIAWKKD